MKSCQLGGTLDGDTSRTSEMVIFKKYDTPLEEKYLVKFSHLLNIHQFGDDVDYENFS